MGVLALLWGFKDYNVIPLGSRVKFSVSGEGKAARSAVLRSASKTLSAAAPLGGTPTGQHCCPRCGRQVFSPGEKHPPLQSKTPRLFWGWSGEGEAGSANENEQM